ncbi:unnamed protein product [Ixodes persulcatus]
MLFMESTSVQTTKEVSVRVALYRQVWEGRATMRACFSEARTANWASRGSSDCELVGETRARPPPLRVERSRRSSRSLESVRSFHCSLEGSISSPLPSRNEMDRIGPFSRNMLPATGQGGGGPKPLTSTWPRDSPLGDAITGCWCLDSMGTVSETASTDPRWVPTQRLGEVDRASRCPYPPLFRQKASAKLRQRIASELMFSKLDMLELRDREKELSSLSGMKESHGT